MNNLITAKEICESLSKTPSAWITRCALIARPNEFDKPYETTQAVFYPETTVRVPTNQKTRRGYPKPQRRRIDLVALVRPNYKAWQPVVVGVEIKVSLSDLKSDTKIRDYLPYCHLFWLAVPIDILEAASERVKSEFPGVGLMSFDRLPNNHLFALLPKHPNLSTPNDKHLQEIYAELLLKQMNSSQTEGVTL